MYKGLSQSFRPSMTAYTSASFSRLISLSVPSPGTLIIYLVPLQRNRKDRFVIPFFRTSISMTSVSLTPSCSAMISMASDFSWSECSSSSRSCSYVLISTTSELYTTLARTIIRSLSYNASSQKELSYLPLPHNLSILSRTAAASSSARYDIPIMAFPAQPAGTVTRSILRFTLMWLSLSIKSETMYQEYNSFFLKGLLSHQISHGMI